ncbi:WYL domain-containing protein [Shewanella algae]|uniref:WYL domain-containing protein n=1 Tax=Shewanella algae TaxID=38313 RepID=UPI00046982B4|nr:WYL domain-containing protein [Shewanella algae]NKZ44326.1 WYL domain-containing protein [Shewanella algae]QTE79161.1 WYL domain-containing protein [Shewanella algae]
MNTQTIKPAKSQRLAFIEFRLYYLGSVSRQDVTERFDCSDAVATRDLSDYQNLREQNCTYDKSTKKYDKTNGIFDFLFDLPINKVLLELIEGGQTLLEAQKTGIISGCTPISLVSPNKEIVSEISRSIYKGKVLKIKYKSLNSGGGYREIIPHSIFSDGLKWYVRAYDRKRELFINLNITRITEATETSLEIENNEIIQSDKKWNSTVPLVLAPHPNVKHKEAIEADYNMDNGEKIVYVKTSMVEFFLRKWNIDCSPAGNLLKGDEYQLWLKNNQALLGICDFKIAPGFKNHD